MFLCLSQPSPMWNWLMATHDIPKELVLLYIVFLNDPLYIQWDQFITVQITFPIKYNLVTLNDILVFKRLCMNLLNIVILWILKVVLGGHPVRLRTIWTIFKSKLSKGTIHKKVILWFQLSVASPSRIYLNLFINALVIYLLLGYRWWWWKDSQSVYQLFLACSNPILYIYWIRQLTHPDVPTLMSLSFLLGSCFKWIFIFLCWKHLRICVRNFGYILCNLIPLSTPTQKKRTPINTIKLLFNKLKNQDKKFAFIQLH